MEMKAGMVMADGPYRHVRNPLYVGTWLMCAAMAFIMPATGALVAMVLLSVFLWRLILGEERFLTAQIGAPYLAYRRAVPRIIPQLRTNLPSTTHKAHWGASMLSELNPIGVFVTLAVFSWSYNNRLMVRAILVSFGLSLVVQALMPQVRRESVAA
jgi:protein-S-isoprenylcysteine O-methyltransferase Ste14